MRTTIVYRYPVCGPLLYTRYPVCGPLLYTRYPVCGPLLYTDIQYADHYCIQISSMRTTIVYKISSMRTTIVYRYPVCGIYKLLVGQLKGDIGRTLKHIVVLYYLAVCYISTNCRTRWPAEDPCVCLQQNHQFISPIAF